MTSAVGRLHDPESGRLLGTVFAVSRRLALTASHCVTDRGGAHMARVTCIWQAARSHAAVLSIDAENDVALLRMDQALPSALDPIQLSSEVAAHELFLAPGAVGELPELPIVAASGEVLLVAGRLPGGARGIQLRCNESAAGLSLHGLSGAPVLIGNPQLAVGLVRWNPPRSDAPDLAAGSIVYAAPVSAILQAWPNLADADLTEVMRRISSRGREFDESAMNADVRRLLVSGGIGIGIRDLETESAGAGHQLTFIDSGQAVLRVIPDFRSPARTALFEQELAGPVRARSDLTGQSYAGILTDGAQWRLYRLRGPNLVLVDRKTSSPREAGDLLGWLDSILATSQNLPPTRYEIDAKLGASSPAYILSTAELAALYAQNSEVPTVKVKRSMWAKLLTTASGLSFDDGDALFVDHTLLVSMAKLIGHEVLGIETRDPAVSAAVLMSGERFKHAGIGGVVEADFFDWVTEMPGGDSFIRNLARRLARFDWSNVDHDVLKHLYESVIPPQTRHQLGEYYTPDWLAERLVAESVIQPLDQRVLDASCGSGTFLFHAVRSYLAAAKRSRRTSADAISGLVTHVIGIDVHPVAVTLARVTYLLAIGSAVLTERPYFSIPVYLGDSMRWGEEFDLTLDSYDGLSIPTRLDPESFVTAPAPADRREFADQLNFPDSVVADAERFDQLVARLADLTKTPRSEAEGAITAVLAHFEVREADQRDLLQTFERMCRLHDEGRDHIWGYYVRNVARPAWLARSANRVDIVVGNPPWLVQRHMTRPQQAAFRAMSERRGLWAGGTLATNQDLAGLFVSRCIELYLKTGGTFAYVMPRSVLASDEADHEGTYAGFRAGNYSTAAEQVKVSFHEAWDLAGVRPSFFPLPACVVIGQRLEGNKSPMPLTRLHSDWSGRFDTQAASWSEAEQHLSMVLTEAIPQIRGGPSRYATRFAQGANFVPYFLFNVEDDDANPLGTQAGKRAIRSRTSGNEKPPWKCLPRLHGVVEREFVLPLYTGESIMPFRLLHPSVEALIPWDGHRLVPGDSRGIEAHEGLARWWREAEGAWNKNRKSESLSLIDQLDYRGKLSSQLRADGVRVVYGGSGVYMAAAIALGRHAVVEHQLYWGLMDGMDEARFLTAILNSRVATEAIRHVQKMGEHNPRHIGKKIFRLPIPLFDRGDAAHIQLVALSEHAEHVASSVRLPSVRFQLQRKAVREALEHDGVAADIDSIVKTMLSQ